MSTPSVFAALVDSSTGFAAPASEGLSDVELMQTQRSLAEFRRRVDAWSASVAAEIAHRSRHELGGEGLAQRHGARTPELLVQHLAGTSVREAHTMVRVGTLIVSPSPLDAVGAAVADGHLSLDAADAIRSGLSAVDASVPTESVTAAAESLVLDAASLTVEKLAARAREWGAELDEQHVLDRERALRDARYLRITPQADGMTRLSGLLDPESVVRDSSTPRRSIGQSDSPATSAPPSKSRSTRSSSSSESVPTPRPRSWAFSAPRFGCSSPTAILPAAPAPHVWKGRPRRSASPPSSARSATVERCRSTLTPTARS